jgi:transposase-like protein
MSTPARNLSEAVEAYMARCTRRPSGCLEGAGPRYGKLMADRTQVSAHRAAYIVHNGPIPDGYVVRHACDNPPCVEPTHLLVGTHADNEADKWQRGRGPLGLEVQNATVSPEVIADSVSRYLAGGRTQAEMAHELGVTQSTFGRWVRAEARRDAGLPPVSIGKGRKVPANLKPCGTRAAWFRHRQLGEDCSSCRAAYAQHAREYRAQRREAS